MRSRLSLLAFLIISCAHAGRPAWAPEPRMAAEPTTVAFPPAALGPVPDTMRAVFRLVLNIPAYRLEAYEGLRLVRRYLVAVGDRAFPTPIGTFWITRIEWNPWWVPPASDWAKADTVTPPPGPGNPMGRVKLFFLDSYFLHGTPQPASVGSAASHGCVRLVNQDAIDLAILIHRYASPDVLPEDVRRFVHLTPADRTRRVTLRHPVPLEIRYDVVEIRGDQIVAYPDIYHLGGERIVTRALGALARLGLDTAAINGARLDRLVQEAGRGPTAIPILELLIP